MATTFGARPEDTVADSRGNVLSGVVLSLYPTQTDAAAQTSLIATVSTNAKGLWPYSDTASRSLLWVRDPNGAVWPTGSQEALAAVGGKADQTYVDNGLNGKVAKDTVVINVKDAPYNAVGDGSNDDTVEINAAITAGAGKTVFVPKGTYMIDATTGLKLNQANTRLLLDPGATLRVIPNSATGYMLLEVTAADCVVEGGTLMGDVGSHTGSTGEWGHLIVANPGSDRLAIRGVKVTKAWGDGITLQGGTADITVTDCVADDNRRQGMSIISAVRPRVNGGVYKNTGLTAFTSPGAGIDVEPNSSTSVTDCQITGVTFSGNKGPGLQVASATGSTCEVTATGGRSTGNTGDGTTANGYGFYAVGPAGTIKAKVTGLLASGNALHGFMVSTESVELAACTARSNTQHGFNIAASEATLTGCRASDNGRVGYQIASSSVLNTNLVSCVAKANSQTTNGAYVNFDNSGVGTKYTGCVSDAGTLTNKPAYGWLLRASSTARLLGCDVRNTFTAANFSDGSGAGNSTAFPVPGVARAAAITTPNTQTASYVQADVQSLKTAIDAIRTALTSHGITS
jgi:hypothetical protein